MDPQHLLDRAFRVLGQRCTERDAVVLDYRLATLHDPAALTDDRR